MLTVDKPISWGNLDSVSYAHKGSGPDIGAFEFVPKFELRGLPGDTEIYLTWEISEELPETAVLEIQYVGPKGSPPSPITSIPQDTNQYVLTGMKNYTFYQITLLAVVNGEIILSDTIEVMPTDIFSFLPFIAKSP